MSSVNDSEKSGVTLTSPALSLAMRIANLLPDVIMLIDQLITAVEKGQRLRAANLAIKAATYTAYHARIIAKREAKK